MLSKFDTKKIKNKGHVYFVRMTETDGERAWYYVEVSSLKEPLFKNKCQEKDNYFNLNDYGVVLDKGWGDNPPEEIRKKYEGEE